MNQETLFKNKSNCCGCEACANICPQKAITMEEDEFGFKYPVIDEEKCIDCDLCKRKCSYQNDIKFNKNEKSFVAVTNNKNILEKSASGGVFAQIATNFIADGGIVYGCSMEKADNKLIPMHIRIDNEEDIIKLQGSKYVQSDINKTYLTIKEDLENNIKVLFSGTPCQVAALKNFIGEKKCNNLYTIDIICHGIPSKKMFQDYIDYVQKNEKKEIEHFIFRDKTKGWGLYAKAFFKDNTSKNMSSHFSSYYQLFLNSEIYRENCYSCKYAGKDRVGDITIGDFWGIEQEHPNYLVKNGGSINPKLGVSCILVNNSNGKDLIDNYAKGLNLNDSQIQKVAKKNKQLNEASKMPESRNKIMTIYKEQGYKYVDEYYYKRMGKKKILFYLWDKIPDGIKKKLKQ